MDNRPTFNFNGVPRSLLPPHNQARSTATATAAAMRLTTNNTGQDHDPYQYPLSSTLHYQRNPPHPAPNTNLHILTGGGVSGSAANSNAENRVSTTLSGISAITSEIMQQQQLFEDDYNLLGGRGGMPAGGRRIFGTANNNGGDNNDDNSNNSNSRTSSFLSQTQQFLQQSHSHLNQQQQLFQQHLYSQFLSPSTAAPSFTTALQRQSCLDSATRTPTTVIDGSTINAANSLLGNYHQEQQQQHGEQNEAQKDVTGQNALYAYNQSINPSNLGKSSMRTSSSEEEQEDDDDDDQEEEQEREEGADGVTSPVMTAWNNHHPSNHPNNYNTQEEDKIQDKSVEENGDYDSIQNDDEHEQQDLDQDDEEQSDDENYDQGHQQLQELLDVKIPQIQPIDPEEEENDDDSDEVDAGETNEEDTKSGVAALADAKSEDDDEDDSNDNNNYFLQDENNIDTTATANTDSGHGNEQDDTKTKKPSLLSSSSSSSDTAAAFKAKSASAPSKTNSKNNRKPSQTLIDARTAHESAVMNLQNAKKHLESIQKLYDEAKLDVQTCQQTFDATSQSLYDIELSEPNPWNVMYQKMKSYKEKYGHCRSVLPAQRNADPQMAKLGNWIQQQRLDKKRPISIKTSLLRRPYRIRALNELGFIWDQKEVDWLHRLEQLKEFKEKHGHTSVPVRYKPLPELGIWCMKQREDYRIRCRGYVGSNPRKLDRAILMTDWRLKKLNEVGYNFEDPNVTRRNEVWEERIEELKKYKERYGDLNISVKQEGCHRLGRWVQQLRREYRAIQKKKEHQDKEKDEERNLKEKDGESVDDTEEKKGDKSDRDRNGMKNENSENNKKTSVRNLPKEKRLQLRRIYETEAVVWLTSPSRIQTLESLGFEWNRPLKNSIAQTWNIRYKDLFHYKSKFGNTKVPKEGYGRSGEVLYRWVMSQVTFYWHCKKREEKKEKSRREKEKVIANDTLGERKSTQNKKSGEDEANVNVLPATGGDGGGAAAAAAENNENERMERIRLLENIDFHLDHPDPLDSLSLGSEAEPKRKVGRPRKHPLPAATSTSTAEFCATTPSSDTAAKKKDDGRTNEQQTPKKRKIMKKTPPVAATTAKDVQTLNQSHKRKRGRPQKNDEVEKTKGPKKKRGRPCKKDSAASYSTPTATRPPSFYPALSPVTALSKTAKSQQSALKSIAPAMITAQASQCSNNSKLSPSLLKSSSTSSQHCGQNLHPKAASATAEPVVTTSMLSSSGPITETSTTVDDDTPIENASPAPLIACHLSPDTCETQEQK